MDDRLRISLWMVGGGGFGGVLGCIFGALAATLYARSGGAAGTRLARNVVENFLQSRDGQPSPTFHAAIIGAVDGFFFLGGFGLIAGSLLGLTGRPVGELLVPMVVGSVALVGGAVFFGTLAYALTRRHGTVALLSALAGGFLGPAIAGGFGNGYTVACGVLGGFFVGVLFIHAARLYSPTFHPPRVEKTRPQPRSDANANITGPPPTPQNDDFFPKDV